MFVYILLCVCGLLYWAFAKNNQVKLPPSFPGSLPFVGHGHLLFGDQNALWNLIENLGRFTILQGGVSYIRIGPQLFYVVCDTDDYIKVSNECLEKNYFYTKILNPWIGDGLVSAPVAVWKRISKILHPTFNKLVVYQYLGVFNDQARRLVGNLARYLGQGPFDAKGYLKHAVMEVSFYTTFGLDFNEDSLKYMKQYFKSIDILTRVLTQRIQTLWMHSDFIYGLTPTKRKQEEALKIVNDFSKFIMAQKREATKNGAEKSQIKQGKFKGYLDLILELSENGSFNDRDILDHVNSSTFANFRTTSTTLMMILVVIGSYPDVQSRIYEELQEVFGGTDRDVNTEDLAKLVYLEAVIKEVSRLFPVIPVIIRYVDRDVKLKNYTMKAGSNCVILLNALNRDKVWGADRDKFRPERWLEGDLPPTPNIYTGFGAGKRACKGQSYAMILIKVTLAHFFRHYKVTADYTKLQMDMHITLEPMKGHYISLESRG